jgi:uncharacterized protein DUF5050
MFAPPDSGLRRGGPFLPGPAISWILAFMGGRCRLLLALGWIALLACTRNSLNDPCGPLSTSPIVLAQPARQPGGISTDHANVYWAEIAKDGSIMSVPKVGGPARSVSLSEFGGVSSVTDDEYIYWAVFPGRLERAPKSGGSNQVLASKDTKVAQEWSQLAVDDAFVYWLNVGSQDQRVKPNPGRIMKVPKSGGDVTVIVEREGLHDMAVSREHIYWTADDGVWREPKIGGAAEHFIEAQERWSNALALDDRYVYWTDRTAIRRKPISGAPIEVVLSTGAGALRLSGQCIYFTGNNAISRVAKSGGKSSTLVAFNDETETGGIFAVDDSAVYWTVWPKATKSWRLMKLATK